jgi:hypothetical protein
MSYILNSEGEGGGSCLFQQPEMGDKSAIAFTSLHVQAAASGSD